MRIFFCFILFLSVTVIADGQEALIVYAVKGNVTAIYKKEETRIKIGRALVQGTILNIDQASSVTLVCKKGKQFVISQPGQHSLSRYKDSCKYTDKSITAYYLSYVWGQFYEYSAEHKAEKKETLLAVSRSPGNENKRKHNSKKLEIEFSDGMDSVFYGGKDFSLGWNCYDYEGTYIFRLFDDKGSRSLFIDSTEDNFILISKFSSLLMPGKIYKWNVAAPNAGLIRKRVLKYIPQPEIDNYIGHEMAELIPNENLASKYFRIAFMLERKHYLADALEYYTKANKEDPSIHIYRDKLIKFRNEFWVQN